ncbi:MAG: SocA family protein [Nitrospirae bacterium]|nr:SocA family protein [Nitrospirota bacterium]
MGNYDMLKELVYYICWKCRSNPAKLDGTRLNKILWYIDTYSYRLWGKSMSGEQSYLKKQFGPVPVRIDDVLSELRSENKLKILKTDFYGYPKYEFVTFGKANVNLFSDDQINIIDNIVDSVCDNHTAASISSLSHDFIWDMAKDYEEIPIYTVLANRPDELTDSDFNWADKIINHMPLKENNIEQLEKSKRNSRGSRCSK